MSAPTPPTSPAADDAAPAYYQFTRPDVQRLVRLGARRVLDVGCAAGAMGAELRAQRPGLSVDGIEMVPEVARQAARRLDRVYVGRAEDVAGRIPDGTYDVIVFADVLEHIADPGLVLERLQPKLAPGGEIVLCIPNVRHWSVLRQLLEGRFDYAELGILDRTHLRFFTRQTLLQLLAHHGLGLLHLERVVTRERAPAPLLQALQAAGLAVDTLAEESAAYQYLCVARPTRPVPALTDDRALRERLAEALASARGAAAALRHGDSGGARGALWALQLVAVLCEATAPPRVTEELYQSFARVLQHVTARLSRGVERLEASAVGEAAAALEALAGAVGAT